MPLPSTFVWTACMLPLGRTHKVRLFCVLKGPCRCGAMTHQHTLFAQVPLDGIVVWGTASVSLQHISGESAPVRAATGSEVPAGQAQRCGRHVR
eukprot:315807-Pelagomonas_calceolata.AAC.1